MRILLLSLLFILMPLPGLALEYEDCDEGTAECYCPPDLGPEQFDQSVITSRAECQETCQIYENQYSKSDPSKSITHYIVQCNIDGSLHTIDFNGVDDEITDYQAFSADGSTEEVIENEAPYEALELNVDIPGLDFDIPYKAIVTLDDGTTQEVVINNALGQYIEAVYVWVLAAGSLLAVVMLMLGGLQYMLARGQSGAIGKAKKRLVNAITGIVLLFGAYTIAFLVNPETIYFDALNVTLVDRTEWYEEEIYTEIIEPAQEISGDLVDIYGNHVIKWAKDNRLHPDAAAALEVAAQALKDSTGKDLVVTSAVRTVEDQAELFYDNCLSNSGKSCTVLTCNPAGGTGIITGSSRGYTFAGELAGITDKETIINAIVNNANVANCPHTSTIAVDVWCRDGGKGFVHDPQCQVALSEAMVTNGFCRIKAEAWHFEYDAMHVCRDCSTSNTHSYTDKYGTPHTPDLSCDMWDYLNHTCK